MDFNQHIANAVYLMAARGFDAARFAELQISQVIWRTG